MFYNTQKFRPEYQSKIFKLKFRHNIVARAFKWREKNNEMTVITQVTVIKSYVFSPCMSWNAFEHHRFGLF